MCELKMTCARPASPRSLVIWESKLVPNTLGVFARLSIQKGDIIGTYTGREFPTMRQLLSKNPGSEYALQVKKKSPRRRTVYVDGDYRVYPEQSCSLSLINGTLRYLDGNAFFRTNATLVARRLIRAGEEVVSYYGSDYFNTYTSVSTVRKRGGWRSVRLTDDELHRAQRWNDQEFSRKSVTEDS